MLGENSRFLATPRRNYGEEQLIFEKISGFVVRKSEKYFPVSKIVHVFTYLIFSSHAKIRTLFTLTIRSCKKTPAWTRVTLIDKQLNTTWCQFLQEKFMRPVSRGFLWNRHSFTLKTAASGAARTVTSAVFEKQNMDFAYYFWNWNISIKRKHFSEIDSFSRTQTFWISSRFFSANLKFQIDSCLWGLQQRSSLNISINWQPTLFFFSILFFLVSFSILSSMCVSQQAILVFKVNSLTCHLPSVFPFSLF